MLNLQEIGLQSVCNWHDTHLKNRNFGISLLLTADQIFTHVLEFYILSKASFNFPTVASVPLLCIHCTRNSTQHSLVMWRFSSSIIFMVLWRKPTVSDKNSWDTLTKRCFFPSSAPLVPLKVVHGGSVPKSCTPTLRGRGDHKVFQPFWLRL